MCEALMQQAAAQLCDSMELGYVIPGQSEH